MLCQSNRCHEHYPRLDLQRELEDALEETEKVLRRGYELRVPAAHLSWVPADPPEPFAIPVFPERF